MGDHLDKVRLTGGEAEEDTRGEDDEQDNRDKNVGVEHLYVGPNFFSNQKHIPRLMVRSPQVHILVAKALQSTQQLTPHLIRVQSGFLPDANLRNAQALADTLQDVLRELQSTLRNPPLDHNPPIVPLK